MTWAVLSTGPSMSQAVADRVRHLPRVAVNLAFRLAPDAEALAGSDTAFWCTYADARTFAGRKFTAWKYAGVERVQSSGISASSCSGVLALEVARAMGAQRILLLGMDFSGTHYFGDYEGTCKRKTPTNWSMHRNQFRLWKRANPKIEVLNCTPGSKLTVFPAMDLEAALATA